MAMFTGGLDGSIMNVALSAIIKDLCGDDRAVSWIVTVHLMVLAGLILIFGKISDRRVADTGLHRRILGVRVQLARPCESHRLSFSYLEERETELI
jgi:MFS family permease